jgi:carboxypeptidase C (cathepsin A)
MLSIATLFVMCIVPGAEADYSPEALQDEIHGLPDAPPGVNWRMFSGYIDVSAPEEKEGTRQMFYWFVESQNEPAKDPVMLWTNGGPGCSGLGGFLSEQGPFRAVHLQPWQPVMLKSNDFTWTKVANMVFIEQPVGVGFSTAANKIKYGDEQAASDNLRFVKGFFKRYPQYALQDFYISSESYGGHYMPTLAKKLLDDGSVPQFSGVFLGNPLTYMMYRNYGQYGTYWGHQLLPAPLWAQYEAAHCASTFPPSSTCTNITSMMDEILAGFDPYALDYDICSHPGIAAGRHERWTLHHTVQRAMGALQGKQLQVSAPYDPCSMNHLVKYLNRADVQAAIHVKQNTTWSMCSEEVSRAYNATDVNLPMMPIWKELIHRGDLNIMIVSGDDDSICATLGTQQWIWDLGYSPKAGKTWSPWKVADQVAGFQTHFAVPTGESRGAFGFTTVHSAGHMVPSTQPERSLALVKEFLGKSSSTADVVVV